MSLYAEWLDVPFFSVFSVVTEAGYVQRGFTETMELRDPDGAPAGTAERTSRLDYVTTAALGTMSVPVLGGRPYLIAGPRLDVLVNRAPGAFEFGASEVEGIFEDVILESELAESFESPAFGVTVGAGVALPRVLPARLSLEARYDRDITDSTSAVPAETRNNAFTVTLGVGF